MKKQLNRPVLAKLQEDYPRIRETDAVQISELINYLVILLNIKISTEEKAEMNMRMMVVGEFLKKKYSDLTIEEVKEAFRMFVAREFPKIKPFRVLDAISIGEVLTEYRTYRQNSLKIYNSKKALPKQTEVTQSEKEEIRKRWKSDFMQRFKNKENVNDAWLLYDELIADGLFVSDEKKRRLVKLETKKHKTSLKSKEPKKYKELKRNPTLLDNNNYIINKCKSILVLEYLNKLVELEKMKNE